jgi:uncharacterized linocin/CFP29 family protein
VPPVIEKKFSISWRDLEASRANGLTLDVQDAIDAARQCAEEEDKLLISGQYTGWKALGIEGLATATGRNTQASGGAWPATSLTNLSNAIGSLRHQATQTNQCTHAYYDLVGLQNSEDSYLTLQRNGLKSSRAMNRCFQLESMLAIAYSPVLG